MIHRRRTLKPGFSPVTSSTDVVYKTVETRAFTEYDVSGNGPATVTDENGKTWYRIRYFDLGAKPVTPSVPEKPVQKLRLPKGKNGVKTRVPVSKKPQTKPSSPEGKKLRLPKGNNGAKTRVPV